MKNDGDMEKVENMNPLVYYLDSSWLIAWSVMPFHAVLLSSASGSDSMQSSGE